MIHSIHPTNRTCSEAIEEENGEGLTSNVFLFRCDLLRVRSFFESYRQLNFRLILVNWSRRIMNLLVELGHVMTIVRRPGGG